jgi:signal transduction histidine kinase
VGDYRSLLIDNEDKINLNIVYEPKSVILNADKERIVQVISNLVSNAIKSLQKKKELYMYQQIRRILRLLLA